MAGIWPSQLMERRFLIVNVVFISKQQPYKTSFATRRQMVYGVLQVG